MYFGNQVFWVFVLLNVLIFNVSDQNLMCVHTIHDWGCWFAVGHKQMAGPWGMNWDPAPATRNTFPSERMPLGILSII